MSSQVLNSLEVLKPSSRKAINPAVLSRLWDTNMPLSLVKRELVANANWQVRPRDGVSSLVDKANCRSRRKVKTLEAGASGNLLQILNTELLGGQNYPVLTTALGMLAGAASSGAGFMFSSVSAGYDTFRQAPRVLARDGDEVWHIEEIGKEQRGGVATPVYISSFFISDPYRRQSASKGWLIHEERHELVL